MVYPIRKSDKPPYIYWKPLVIIGVILLAVTLPLVTLSTYVYVNYLFREKGSIKLIENAKIPEKIPEELITQFREYITNLSIEPHVLNPEQCEEVRFTLITLGSNNSVSVDTAKDARASLLSSGVEVFEVRNVEGGANCNILVNYTYVIYAIERPYSYFLFISIFTAFSGAACGVIGVVLMIKQRVLKKFEDQYL